MEAAKFPLLALAADACGFSRGSAHAMVYERMNFTTGKHRNNYLKFVEVEL